MLVIMSAKVRIIEELNAIREVEANCLSCYVNHVPIKIESMVFSRIIKEQWSALLGKLVKVSLWMTLIALGLFSILETL